MKNMTEEEIKKIQDEIDEELIEKHMRLFKLSHPDIWYVSTDHRVHGIRRFIKSRLQDGPAARFKKERKESYRSKLAYAINRWENNKLDNAIKLARQYEKEKDTVQV